MKVWKNLKDGNHNIKKKKFETKEIAEGEHMTLSTL